MPPRRSSRRAEALQREAAAEREEAGSGDIKITCAPCGKTRRMEPLGTPAETSRRAHALLINHQLDCPAYRALYVKDADDARPNPGSGPGDDARPGQGDTGPSPVP